MPKDKRSNPSSSISTQGSLLTVATRRIIAGIARTSWKVLLLKRICGKKSDVPSAWSILITLLLICSSHEKGCRPFICDTIHGHSNCFDQFCKLHGLTPSKSTSTDDQPNGFLPYGCRRVLGLVCPLCRGNISGWIVVQGANTYMNSRIRGCSLESCDFSGNYGELRKHARLQHSRARPSEVDNERRSDWERLERNDNRL